MNRTKEQIKEKIDSLREEAEKLGVVLNINENNFFEKRQHHMWYGGEIASFEYKGITVYIEAIGDIYITLNDENGKYVTHVKDKSNSCNFFHGMRDYIPDDKTLIEYLGWERDADSDIEPRLEITDNNWIEFNLYDNQKNRWIEYGDNVMDEEDVLDAIDLKGLMEVVDECISEEE